jgi:hypothetical protein
MRVPFIIWSAVLAGLVYAGFVGLDFMNFGEVSLSVDRAQLIGGIWAGAVVMSLIIGWVRREAASKPLDAPEPHFGADPDD